MRTRGDPCECCGTANDGDTASHADGCPIKIYRESATGEPAGYAQNNWDDGRLDGYRDAPTKSDNASYLLGHKVGAAELAAEREEVLAREAPIAARLAQFRHIVEQCRQTVH